MRGGMVVALLLVVVVAAAASAAPAEESDRVAPSRAHPKYLDAIFAENGRQDPFLSLSNAELNEWSRSQPKTSDFEAALQRGFKDATHVHVVLVGLDGILSAPIKVAPHELTTLLRHERFLAQPLSTLDGRALGVESSLHFTVDHADPALARHIHDRIAELLQGQTEFLILRVTLLDEIIAAHYAGSKSHTPTLYLINAGRHGAGYAWAPDNAEGEFVCATPHWVGVAPYMWLDLNAGPLEWGPSFAGEGVAGAHAIPFIDDLPSFANPHYRNSFVASLAGYAAHAAMRLISTAPVRVPFLALQSHSRVRFVLIADTQEGLEIVASQASQVLGVMKDHLGDAEPVSSDAVQARTSSSSAIQTALARARRYHTAAHASQQEMPRHEHLDSAELSRWLLRLLPAEIEIGGNDTLPVFLLHFDREPLLLDRSHQAVAFADAVVAVTGGPKDAMLSHNFFCNSKRHSHVRVSTNDVVRPILAAIYSSFYGVAPTHKRFEARHQRVESDYLWSVTPTVSGVLSRSRLPSFSLLHQVRRNAVLAALSIHLEWFARLAQLAATKDILHIESPELATLSRRWSVWLWKRHEVEVLLAAHSYEDALLLVKTMRFESQAMEVELSNYLARSVTTLHCFDSTLANQWHSSDAMGLTVVVVSLLGSALLLTRAWRIGTSADRVPTTRHERLPTVQGSEFD